MHGSANLATLHRRLASTGVAGDQQNHPVASRNSLFQHLIDRLPGAVEAMSMKVERTIDGDVARPQASVPMTIERAVDASGPSCHWRR